jgi:hypothetical protein
MPNGTLLAAQILKAPDYVMITGLINQTLIDIQGSDPGGELDPHGQDLVCVFDGAIAYMYIWVQLTILFF